MTNQIIEITGISNLGQGFSLAPNNKKNKKIFVSKTLIGDKIEAQIIKENSKFIAANLIKIISPSPDRATPPCPHFADCGGCSLQHLTVDYYQSFKQKILLDLFARDQITFDGNIDWSFIPAGFRRRVNFQVDHNHRLGFFRENSNDVVKIESCLILEKEIAALIHPLQDLVKNITTKITQISITKFDNGIAAILQTPIAPSLEVADGLTNFAKDNNIISLAYRIADDCNLIYQSQIPQLFFGDIKIDLNANIFLQATKAGQDIIINEINDLVTSLQTKNPEKILNIVDLYCGIGTYSFAALSQNAKTHIKAFEGEKSMIEALNKNATKNNLNQKIQGFEKDLVKTPLLPKELTGQHLAIINPPRNGAESQTQHLAKSKIKSVIYISCNPSAFAVDAKILLQNGYKITKIKAIDQFVYSHHLELVAVFEKL
ncbi:MAG: 23S rRNA (uracil(1939)-C(5))-methyltransferase RlmD [Pseudomonadota bacterium]